MTDTENPFPEPVEIEITDSLDLHSFSPKDIRAVVEAYLPEAHQKGFFDRQNNSRQRRGRAA